MKKKKKTTVIVVYEPCLNEESMMSTYNNEYKYNPNRNSGWLNRMVSGASATGERVWHVL